MTYTREQVARILRDNGVSPSVLDPYRIRCVTEENDFVVLEGDGEILGRRSLTIVEGGIRAQVILNGWSACKLIAVLKAGFGL